VGCEKRSKGCEVVGSDVSESLKSERPHDRYNHAHLGRSTRAAEAGDTERKRGKTGDHIPAKSMLRLASQDGAG
jgi:hypothetical protein